MLYLEVESEALRFFSINGSDMQSTTYRMLPTQNFEKNLRQALGLLPSTANTRQAVRVIISQPGTAMPLNDFNEEVCDSVFRHCFPERTGEQVFYDMIPESNAVWIFGMPKEQCKAIEGLFGEVFYASAMAPLARFTLQQTAGQEHLMVISSRQGWTDIIAVQGKRLLLANSYQVQAFSDVAYYTTSVVKQLQFDQKADRYLLVGKSDICERTAEELLPFLPNLTQQHDIEAQLLKYLH